MALDPSAHAYRADVADIALAGKVIASHYAQPAIRSTLRDLPLRSNANDSADVVVTLAKGDEFAVLDCGRGLAWGFTVEGHRVGYVDEDSLA